MMINGWTSWGWEPVTRPEMRTWKHHSGEIYLTFPRNYDRESILSQMAFDCHLCSALDEPCRPDCPSTDPYYPYGA